MMARIKAGLLSLRDLFATAWWIVLIVGIGFAVAYPVRRAGAAE
jgi:hypothetical protein